MMKRLAALSLVACLAWLMPGCGAADSASRAAAKPDATATPAFAIGDTPPPLAPMAWIKDEPVTAFERDHVYVVAFFATWCGASRQSMPLLSEVARRHQGELTVIGINVRQSEHAEATVAAVTEFVRGRKDMAYTVAMDDPLSTPMFTSWMRAAGMYAIPTAFIIGSDGRLAYVGIPIDPAASYGFELAIEQAVAGTSDLAAARRLHRELGEEIAWYLADMELMKTLDEAMAREDYPAVLAEADRLVAQDPTLRARVFAPRLSAMLYLDEDRALAFARTSLAGAESDEQSLAMTGTIGGMIAYRPGLSQGAYELAAAYMEATVAQRGGDDFNAMLDLLTLARLQYQIGQAEQAIETQQRAMDIARGRTDVTEEMMTSMEEELVEYTSDVSSDPPGDR